MSLAKVEYVATSKATRQAMWLSSLFGTIGVPQMKSIIIYDNNPNVYLYQRTKSFMFTQSILRLIAFDVKED
jgi:hypothetical protein